MDKAFTNFTWKNSPDVGTPLGQLNLNKINNGLNTVDDRVVALDTGKANQTAVNDCYNSITYNTETGVFTFVQVDGTTQTVDLNIEKIPVSFTLSPEGILTMTCADGTVWTCDISRLIPTYNFTDTDTIDFTDVANNDGSHTVTAIIKTGSITLDLLDPAIAANFTLLATQAAASAVESESYAHGDTGSRTGESTDNAMYYAAQAANSASAAQQYAGLVVPSMYIDVATGYLMQNEDGDGLEFIMDTTTGYLSWQLAS